MIALTLLICDLKTDRKKYNFQTPREGVPLTEYTLNIFTWIYAVTEARVKICIDLEERAIKSVWTGDKSGLETVFQENKHRKYIPESEESISKSVKAAEWPFQRCSE